MSVDTLNKPVPQNPDPVASQPLDSTPWERSTHFRVSSVSGILQTTSVQSVILRHTHKGRNPQSTQENPDPERTQKLGWSGQLCVPAPVEKVSNIKEKVGLPSPETETGNVATGDKSVTPMKNAFLGLMSTEDTDRRESRSFSKRREITQTTRGETGGNQENRADESTGMNHFSLNCMTGDTEERRGKRKFCKSNSYGFSNRKDTMAQIRIQETQPGFMPAGGTPVPSGQPQTENASQRQAGTHTWEPEGQCTCHGNHASQRTVRTVCQNVATAQGASLQPVVLHFGHVSESWGAFRDKCSWPHEIWRKAPASVGLKIPQAAQRTAIVCARRARGSEWGAGASLPRAAHHVPSATVRTLQAPRGSEVAGSPAGQSCQDGAGPLSQCGQRGPGAVGARCHSKSPRRRGNRNSVSRGGREGSLITGTLGREPTHSEATRGQF